MCVAPSHRVALFPPRAALALGARTSTCLVLRPRALARTIAHARCPTARCTRAPCSACARASPSARTLSTPTWRSPACRSAARCGARALQRRRRSVLEASLARAMQRRCCAPASRRWPCSTMAPRSASSLRCRSLAAEALALQRVDAAAPRRHPGRGVGPVGKKAYRPDRYGRSPRKRSRQTRSRLSTKREGTRSGGRERSQARTRAAAASALCRRRHCGWRGCPQSPPTAVGRARRRRRRAQRCPGRRSKQSAGFVVEEHGSHTDAHLQSAAERLRRNDLEAVGVDHEQPRRGVALLPQHLARLNLAVRVLHKPRPHAAEECGRVVRGARAAVSDSGAPRTQKSSLRARRRGRAGPARGRRPRCGSIDKLQRWLVHPAFQCVTEEVGRILWHARAPSSSERAFEELYRVLVRVPRLRFNVAALTRRRSSLASTAGDCARGAVAGSSSTLPTARAPRAGCARACRATDATLPRALRRSRRASSRAAPSARKRQRRHRLKRLDWSARVGVVSATRPRLTRLQTRLTSTRIPST